MKWQLGEDYKTLNKEIDDLHDELRHYWARLTFPGHSYSGIRSKNVTDCVGDGVAKAIDMENELKAKIEGLKHLRLEIEEVIEKLPATYRRLMRMRYIRHFTWQQIATRTYCDESTCRRLHRSILRNLNL